MNQRVVVTGMGVISPVGISKDTFWQALLDGKSGIETITRFDVSEYPAKIAGEVKDFDPSAYIEKKEARRMDPSEQYAILASYEAIEDAKLDIDSVDLDRCGVVIGSGIGGISTFESNTAY